MTYVDVARIRGASVVWRSGGASTDVGPLRDVYYRITNDRRVRGLVGVATTAGSVVVPTERPDELVDGIETTTTDRDPR